MSDGDAAVLEDAQILDVAADADPTADAADGLDELTWSDLGEPACVAAGWQWFEDYVTPTYQHYSELVSCFCVKRCTTDADCEGTTTPFCMRLSQFNFSDNAQCPSDPKYCTPTPPQASFGGCTLPPTCETESERGRADATP